MTVKELNNEKIEQTTGLRMAIIPRDSLPDWVKNPAPGNLIPLTDPRLITTANQQQYLIAKTGGKKRSFGGGTRIVFCY